METGHWQLDEKGLIGSIEGDSAAVIWHEGSYPDEMALVFEAQATPGHDNDANAFFRATGSIYGEPPNDAWIVGTAGWYEHDDGLEHHPQGPTWRVPGEPLSKERAVRVAAGYYRGRVYLWKDGRLLLEENAPEEKTTTHHHRLGLGTWDSAVRFVRLSVYDLSNECLGLRK